MTGVFRTSNKEGALEPGVPGPSCGTDAARFEAEFSSLKKTKKLFRLVTFGQKKLKYDRKHPCPYISEVY
jgi:hypothetical protein